MTKLLGAFVNSCSGFGFPGCVLSARAARARNAQRQGLLVGQGFSVFIRNK